jgi:hypothetical protein
MMRTTRDFRDGFGGFLVRPHTLGHTKEEHYFWYCVARASHESHGIVARAVPQPGRHALTPATGDSIPGKLASNSPEDPSGTPAPALASLRSSYG